MKTMILFLLEGYIELFISALIGFEMMTHIDLMLRNVSDSFNMFVAVCFTVITIGLPVFACWVVTKKIKWREVSYMEDDDKLKYKLKLKEKGFDALYGMFYNGLK